MSLPQAILTNNAKTIMKPTQLKHLSTILWPILLAASAHQSTAAVSLFEAWSNVDGVLVDQTASASFDAFGLGTLTFTVTGAGVHYVSLFVDHEIDEETNTFFNEVGSKSGTPSAGQSWEIDEPGFSGGDIYTNFAGSLLDNANGLVGPEDVSMALGSSMILSATEEATVSFTLSETVPTGGFYLTHTDPDSQKSIYFSSKTTIEDGGTHVPDGGGTLIMLSGALAAMAATLRRRTCV